MDDKGAVAIFWQSAQRDNWGGAMRGCAADRIAFNISYVQGGLLERAQACRCACTWH